MQVLANAETRVIGVFSEQFGEPIENIKVTDNIEARFLPDDLDLLEVLMSLEDEFDIEILDGEDERCNTVQDYINLVQRKAA